MRILGVFVLLLLVQFSSEGKGMDTQVFQAKDVRELKIFNLSGDVRVIGTVGEEIQISTSKHDKCKVEFVNLKGELSAKTVCLTEVSEVPAYEKMIKFKIEVPKRLLVNIETGFGDIRFEDLEKVKIETGSGDISGSGHTLSLRASTGKGDVKYEGQLEEAELQSGLGDLKVHLNSASEKGRVTLNTGKGDARVMLPKTAKAKLSASSGLGSSKSNFLNSPDSKYVIDINTGFGDTRVSTF